MYNFEVELKVNNRDRLGNLDGQGFYKIKNINKLVDILSNLKKSAIKYYNTKDIVYYIYSYKTKKLIKTL